MIPTAFFTVFVDKKIRPYFLNISAIFGDLMAI
jgi:hypothetical protein